jgi:hypothetical protein
VRVQLVNRLAMFGNVHVAEMIQYGSSKGQEKNTAWKTFQIPLFNIPIYARQRN